MCAQPCSGVGDHLVSDLELRHVSAEGLHTAGELAAQNGLSWPADAERQTPQRPEADWQLQRPEPPVGRTHGGRQHADEHFVVVRHGGGQFGQLQNFGRPIAGVGEGLDAVAPIRSNKDRGQMRSHDCCRVYCPRGKCPRGKRTAVAIAAVGGWAAFVGSGSALIGNDWC